MMPRTLELLDQLDLADALGQVGFAGRGQKTYRDGERIELPAAVSDVGDTFFDYVLMARQRWTEQVIADAYTKRNGTNLQYGTRLLDFKITEQVNDYRVVSTIQDQAGCRSQIKSKYIIGADGGRSSVRQLSGIAFEGERSTRRWVRIDGIVETDMPEARYGLTSVQSASHGAVLWACLDHDATRVGFALPKERWAAGENISQDDVIQEAQQALKPFSLGFKTVDWWTVYSIGQRLAANYRVQERIFLVGDAAHTYSSGSAQGMNVGLQDAVNLAWKVAGKVKGKYLDLVLDTYNAERRAIAEQVIAQDKIVSSLTEGKIPQELHHDPEKDSHKLLFKHYVKSQALNSGLGIIYPEDNLTLVSSSAGVTSKVQIGERAPDVLIQRPGIRVPLRLYSQLKHHGNFAVVAFCGDTSKTKDLLRKWRSYLDGAESLMNYGADLIDLITILIHDNHAGAAEENLKIRRVGQVFYDADKSAHERYGVTDERGAVLILRPDGLLGTACGLDEGQLASAYFARFVTSKNYHMVSDQRNGETNINIAKGEVQLD